MEGKFTFKTKYVDIICIYWNIFNTKTYLQKWTSVYNRIISTRNNANNNINKQRGKATKMQHIFIQTNILQI